MRAFTLSSDALTAGAAADLWVQQTTRDTGCGPGGLRKGEPMKRLYLVLSLIFLLAVLAVPAIAQADDDPGFVPAGWTWDES
jgi:hypothetical protein